MSPDDGVLFSPVNGGLGATLTCTGSSSSVALPTPTLGTVFCITNTGTDYVWLAFGNSGVVATSSYLAFPPGLTYIGIPNARGSGAPTHVAGISGGSSIVVQISSGVLQGVS